MQNSALSFPEFIENFKYQVQIEKENAKDYKERTYSNDVPLLFCLFFYLFSALVIFYLSANIIQPRARPLFVI